MRGSSGRIRGLAVVTLVISAAAWVVAQSAPILVTATVQVCSSAGANGPANLVSNALPLRPGALTSAADVRVLDGSTEVPLATQVLATWPADGSIRSLLLQFDAPTAKAYTIQVGAPRTAPARAVVPVTWDVPTRVFTL